MSKRTTGVSKRSRSSAGDSRSLQQRCLVSAGAAIRLCWCCSFNRAAAVRTSPLLRLYKLSQTVRWGLTARCDVLMKRSCKAVRLVNVHRQHADAAFPCRSSTAQYFLKFGTDCSYGSTFIQALCRHRIIGFPVPEGAQLSNSGFWRGSFREPNYRHMSTFLGFISRIVKARPRDRHGLLAVRLLCMANGIESRLSTATAGAAFFF